MDVSLCAAELDLWTDSDISLFKFLNCCKTKSGSEMLLSWIKQPLNDIEMINRRLDMVEYFGNECILRNEIFSKLKKIPNIDKSLKRFQSSSQSSDSSKAPKSKPAKLEHCVQYYQYSKVILEILSLLTSCKFFSREFERLRPALEDLVELVSKGVDLASAKTLDSEYRVRPDFDSRLKEIHEEIESADNQIEKLRVKSTELLGLSKPLSLTHLASHGYLFEGNKTEIYDGIRNPIHITFTIVSHLQKSVKISCEELRDLSKLKDNATALYLSSQIDLEQRIIQLVSNHTPVLQEAKELISAMDAVLSLAHACFTTTSTYSRPFMNKSNLIDIKDCRHPCCDSFIDVVPNSAKMQKHVNSFVLITGPNMGGKSTYLRTVSLIVIMAHIGCFVPAESASLCLVDKVIARIGAGDNQLLGQSTFMCEMVELGVLIKHATPDSLLMIDEIGRGTSSSEGAGIAQGVCEYLSELGCFTLFATHFSELVSIKLKNFSVWRTEVIIKSGNMQLTHQIQPGAATESLGIEIAKACLIPDEIIEDARSIKKMFEDLESLIKGEE